MLKEDDAAFAGGFGRIHVLAVKNPAEAAIAKIADDGLDAAIDGGGDTLPNIATDGFAGSSHGSAHFAEDGFDAAGDEEIEGDFAKPPFQFGEAFVDDMVGKIPGGHAAGHHGDLRRFEAVLHQISDDDGDDDADD